MTDTASRSLRVALGLFCLVFVAVGADLAGDLAAGIEPWHVAAELLAMTGAATGAAYLWILLHRARHENASLVADLARAHAEAERWRAEAAAHLRGLSEAIDRQLERWALSPAEREIALLLIKGLSHKEAAAVRNTSERTVRQQALSVYRKAGVAGRAELAAFFLEDLLQPSPPAARRPA